MSSSNYYRSADTTSSMSGPSLYDTSVSSITNEELSFDFSNPSTPRSAAGKAYGYFPKSHPRPSRGMFYPGSNWNKQQQQQQQQHGKSSSPPRTESHAWSWTSAPPAATAAVVPTPKGGASSSRYHTTTATTTAADLDSAYEEEHHHHNHHHQEQEQEHVMIKTSAVMGGGTRSEPGAGARHRSSSNNSRYAAYLSRFADREGYIMTSSSPHRSSYGMTTTSAAAEEKKDDNDNNMLSQTKKNKNHHHRRVGSRSGFPDPEPDVEAMEQTQEKDGSHVFLPAFEYHRGARQPQPQPQPHHPSDHHHHHEDGDDSARSTTHRTRDLAKRFEQKQHLSTWMIQGGHHHLADQQQGPMTTHQDHHHHHHQEEEEEEEDHPAAEYRGRPRSRSFVPPRNERSGSPMPPRNEEPEQDDEQRPPPRRAKSDATDDTERISNKHHVMEYLSRVEIEYPPPAHVPELKKKLWDPNESLQVAVQPTFRGDYQINRRRLQDNEKTAMTRQQRASRSLSPGVRSRGSVGSSGSLRFKSRFYEAAQRATPDRYTDHKATTTRSVHSQQSSRESSSKIVSTTKSRESQQSKEERPATAADVAAHSDFHRAESQISQGTSKSTTQQSVVSLLAKLNAINRDNPDEALAQIDAILREESKSTTEEPGQPDVGESNAQQPPTKSTSHGVTAKDPPAAPEEGDESGEESDDETSVSSITNPTYTGKHGADANANASPKAAAEANKVANSKSAGHPRPSHLQNYSSPKAAQVKTLSANAERKKSKSKSRRMRSPPPASIQVTSSKDKKEQAAKRGADNKEKENPYRNLDTGETLSHSEVPEGQKVVRDEPDKETSQNQTMKEEKGEQSNKQRPSTGTTAGKSLDCPAVGAAVSSLTKAVAGLRAPGQEQLSTVDPSKTNELSQKISRWDQMARSGMFSGMLSSTDPPKTSAAKKESDILSPPKTDGTRDLTPGRRRPHPWDASIPARMGRVDVRDTSMRSAVGLETEFTPKYDAANVDSSQNSPSRLSISRGEIPRSSNESSPKVVSSKHDVGDNRMAFKSMLGDKFVIDPKLWESDNPGLEASPRVKEEQKEYAQNLSEDFDSAWVALPSSFFPDKPRNPREKTGESRNPRDKTDESRKPRRKMDYEYPREKTDESRNPHGKMDYEYPREKTDESRNPNGKMDYESRNPNGKMDYESRNPNGKMDYESRNPRGKTDYESRNSRGKMDYESRSPRGKMDYESRSPREKTDDPRHSSIVESSRVTVTKKSESPDQEPTLTNRIQRNGPMQTFTPKAETSARKSTMLSPPLPLQGAEKTASDDHRRLSGQKEEEQAGIEVALVNAPESQVPPEPKRRGLRALLKRRASAKTKGTGPAQTGPSHDTQTPTKLPVLDPKASTDVETASLSDTAELPPPARGRNRDMRIHGGERSRSLEEPRIRNPNIAKKFRRLLRVYDDSEHPVQIGYI